MPAHTPHFVISETTNPDYRKTIQGILRAYNEQAATIRGPEAKALNIQVNDAEGQLLGGIVAATYWGWLVIDLFAVVEQARGQGLGKALMEQAESEARRRGCSRAHTSTYAHQALGFYQKLGYGIIGQLDDYPDGYTLYWLQKELL